MTQTLTTTEELRHLASSDNANELTRRFARELLANREAQPVAVTDEMALAFHRALNDGGIGESDLEEIKVGLRGALCNITAPPAPAVPRVTAIPEAATLTNINQLCPQDTNLSQTDFAIGWNDCRQYALTHDRLPPSIKGVHAIAQGWNACRAAMLDQPVSQGYKLVPVEPTEAMLLVLGLTGSFESMNEKWQKMLAAAPEGVENA